MAPNPSLDINLVPVETLGRLRRLFEAVTGVPLVFTDRNGKPVTEVDRPLCFCASLLSPDTPGTVCLRRHKWDEPEPEVEHVLRTAGAATTPLAHHCPGGFLDIAAPIQVDEQTIGYAVFARALPEEPDLERFRALAVKGGMAPEVGETVARHALVMSRERIVAVGQLLQVITGFVASAAYETIRAQRILDLEKQRDDLLHMIVHDLRTPLTSVIGGLQTVVDTDYDPEITREFVPMAISGANTLLEMVNTLLDINKLEAGQMTLDLAEVDFGQIAQTALEQVTGLAMEHGDHLQTALTPDCPPVYADGEKLRRVVTNLLGNAIKFTPDGGTITVGDRCDDTGFTFWVQDNGPGIPAEHQERIFEKFGQVDCHGRHARNSTGLGLTFCKLVAQAHGGRIWVESEEQKGSTFLVFIPARQAAPTPAT